MLQHHAPRFENLDGQGVDASPESQCAFTIPNTLLRQLQSAQNSAPLPEANTVILELVLAFSVVKCSFWFSPGYSVICSS